MIRIRLLFILTTFLTLIAIGLVTLLMNAEVENIGSQSMDNRQSSTSGLEKPNIEVSNVFKLKCASCHIPNRRLIGPALVTIDSTRFFQYFNGEILIDPIARKNSFGTDQEWHQQQFQDITLDQLQEMYQYIQRFMDESTPSIMN